MCFEWLVEKTYPLSGAWSLESGVWELEEKVDPARGYHHPQKVIKLKKFEV